MQQIVAAYFWFMCDKTLVNSTIRIFPSNVMCIFFHDEMIAHNVHNLLCLFVFYFYSLPKIYGCYASRLMKWFKFTLHSAGRRVDGNTIVDENDEINEIRKEILLIKRTWMFLSPHITNVHDWPCFDGRWENRKSSVFFFSHANVRLDIGLELLPAPAYYYLLAKVRNRPSPQPFTWSYNFRLSTASRFSDCSISHTMLFWVFKSSIQIYF